MFAENVKCIQGQRALLIKYVQQVRGVCQDGGGYRRGGVGHLQGEYLKNVINIDIMLWVLLMFACDFNPSAQREIYRKFCFDTF